jgi:hypothetical protein
MSTALIALRTADRFTVIARSAAQTAGRGSAVPLGKRSTVRPGRREMAKVLALRGKFSSPRGLGKFRGLGPKDGR